MLALPITRALLVLACVLSLAGCMSLPSLPSLEGRVASHALAASGATTIGRAFGPMAAAHPGASGVHALLDGRDAFAARMLLAERAERSLDVQYYIWRSDTTGTLLLDALQAAAARGVRVRLLLDDNNTAGMDPTLALLDAHPDIEVRLFNPFAMRASRLLGFAFDFARLNRRMHNKSFTADGQATVVGGRNVGDEYFGATGEVLFSDLDVLAIGPVVATVSADFDRYWNSRSAYPLASLIDGDRPHVAQAALAASRRRLASPAATDYLRTLRASSFASELAGNTLALEWTEVKVVSDDPDKVLGTAAPGSEVALVLPQLLGSPTSQVDLVSPYFVPGPLWTARMGVLAQSGVRLRVLTNSLEATDVAAVHAGYAKWRADLLGAGVTLLELKRAWPAAEGAKRGGVTGSSAVSLHAKTFAVDQNRIFIGSFNFDPRSADLNTEMGLVIHSPALARRMSDVLDTDVLARAYEVKLGADGKLYWLEQLPGGVKRHDTEPGTTAWRRMAVGLIGLLPIDWLL